MGRGRRSARTGKDSANEGRCKVEQADQTSVKPPKSAKILPTPQMNEMDLRRAVDSLYRDQLKPFGRILRKRLDEEGIEVVGLASGEAGLGQLKAICSACSWLHVEAEQGGDWSALLRSTAPNFVDVYNPVDVYPEAMWREAAEFAQTLQEEVLPGGRFSCAQSLVDRKLAFLQGRSLGEVCHIVQLAISQKKIFGYSNGGITWYANSQSMLKDEAAAQQSARAGSAGVAELPLASWALAREHLREILRSSMEQGLNVVPLSNIKRVFRSQFHTELSETALGYSKLSELLQDSRLSDTCTVRLLDQGYFVIPQFTLEDECRVEESEALCLDEEERAASDRWFPYSPFAVNQDGHAGSAVRNTFIHTGAVEHSGSRNRSQSLVKDFGSKKSELELSCHTLGFQSEPLQELDLPSTPAMPALQTFSPLMPALQTFSPFTTWADAGDEHCARERDVQFKFAVLDVDDFVADHEEPLKTIEDLHLPPTPAMPALKTASPVWTWGNEQLEPVSETCNSRFKFSVDEPLHPEGIDDACGKLSPGVSPSPWTLRPNPTPLINLSRQAFRLSDFV